MTKKSEPATKDEVRQIVKEEVRQVVQDEVRQVVQDEVRQVVREEVTEVVGEVANEILTAISEQLEGINHKLDKHDRRLDEQAASINRIENILRPTVDKVDDHEMRLKRLEATAA